MVQPKIWSVIGWTATVILLIHTFTPGDPFTQNSQWILINPDPAEPGYALPLQTVQIQISWPLNWSGSDLFVMKYVNLYQQPGSINLIGWKLEVGVAS